MSIQENSAACGWRVVLFSLKRYFNSNTDKNFKIFDKSSFRFEEKPHESLINFHARCSQAFPVNLSSLKFFVEPV